MKRQVISAVAVVALAFTALLALASGPPLKETAGFVLVKGGQFKNPKSNYYGRGVTVSDFYIGKYEVTQREWSEVMGSNPSKFKGDTLPVETVTWYDSVEYCNRRSIHEGLKPYYNIDKNTKDPANKPDPKFGDLDTIKWTVTTNPEANGYRLPTEAEWEYAADGGQRTKTMPTVEAMTQAKSRGTGEIQVTRSCPDIGSGPSSNKIMTKRRRWGVRSRTNWVSTICRGMSGNGAGTGTETCKAT